MSVRVVVLVLCCLTVGCAEWLKSPSPKPDQVQAAEAFRVPDFSSELTFESDDGPSPTFLDVAKQSGVQFTVYTDMKTDRFFLPTNMGGGVGWFDYDLDGLHDLLIVNGCVLPVDESDDTHVQQLFRQLPDGKFVSTVHSAKLARTFYGQGCSIGDLDNDGFEDVVLTSYGGTYILANRGDGTFADPVSCGDEGWSVCAALGDIDADGDLDLYSSHYGRISLENNPVCEYQEAHGKVRGYCGPAVYDSEPDAVFTNDGAGGFVRIAEGPFATIGASKGLGVLMADLDNDRRLDVFVANDMDANFLFHNQSANDEPLRFEEIGRISGVAYSGEGIPEASMGVACEDFDHDGQFDLFLTHYYRQKNTYYSNKGNMTFLDASTAAGLAAPSFPYLGFGTAAVDYDRDQNLDLIVTNGHVLGPLVNTYEMRPQIFRNQGKRFIETTDRAGPYFFSRWVGRGLATADYDRDGDEDMCISHLDDKPVALLRNDTVVSGESVTLELIGSVHCRTAVGATVRPSTAPTPVHQLVGGGTYASHNASEIVITTPAGQKTVDLLVSWPTGEQEQWTGLQTGHHHLLVEGRSGGQTPSFRHKGK